MILSYNSFCSKIQDKKLVGVPSGGAKQIHFGCFAFEDFMWNASPASMIRLTGFLVATTTRLICDTLNTRNIRHYIY